MDQNKMQGTTGFNFGPIIIFSVHQWLTQGYRTQTILILFADDTSILITSANNIQFRSDLNLVFGQLSKWFKTNLLSLNFDENYFIQFTNKSTCTSDIQIAYKNKFVQLLNQIPWAID